MIKHHAYYRLQIHFYHPAVFIQKGASQWVALCAGVDKRALLLRSVNLDKQTAKGSTALHYCCLTDNSECLKLLLRGKASIDIGKSLAG